MCKRVHVFKMGRPANNTNPNDSLNEIERLRTQLEQAHEEVERLRDQVNSSNQIVPVRGLLSVPRFNPAKMSVRNWMKKFKSEAERANWSGDEMVRSLAE